MQSVNDQPRSNVCGWFTVLFLCAFLTGCGGGGQPAGNEPAGNEPQENSAVVTRSFDGIVAVTSGQTRTVSLTFNSSNANSLANLLVTTDLTALPGGWSAPGTFGCQVVQTDNGCVLHLTYSPDATGSGSLTIAFTYQSATGRMSAGSETISYAATSDSNVVATTSPSGQITAIAGTGSQLVAVTFNADSGTASNLRLQSPLASLPAGWSSPLTEFSCQSVGTGNGCLLPLSFSPAAKATGTLTLEYTYTSDAGVAKSGSATISYLGTTHNNIVALASPAGQITGVVGSSQEITVTFNSDDGNAINGLSLTTDLTQLPVGWSSTAASLSCADVASGNGCRLPLTFAPNAQAAGTLHLTFAYHDDSGAAKTGSLSIDYVATAHNNVAANVVPSGQIAAVAGSGSRSVSVQFATDDGQPAKGLQLTSDLSSLPAGWSSVATEFKCTLVNAGTPCWLPLTFAPSAAGMGSLPLTYTYIDNAGSSKTGSVSIPFAGTTRNNVIAQVDLSSVQIQLGETRGNRVVPDAWRSH